MRQKRVENRFKEENLTDIMNPTNHHFYPAKQEIVSMQREPLLITVEETMRVLRLGRTKIYALIRQEGLPVHRFGRRVLVNPDELKSWLAGRRERDS